MRSKRFWEKGVIRIRISKKNRQHNGQKKKVQKDKQRSTSHTYETKDRVTRTPLKTGGEHRCSGRVGSSNIFEGQIIYPATKGPEHDIKKYLRLSMRD